MATFKQCVNDVFDFTVNVIHSAKPIGQAITYSTVATAEAAGQLLNAVAMSPEERETAQKIVDLYK